MFDSFGLASLSLIYLLIEGLYTCKLIVSKTKYKRKITLTVDPDLWAECREKRDKYGLNWSQIAEEAFLGVLLQLREIEKIIDSAPKDSSGLDTSIVKSRLNDYVNRAFSKLNTELEEVTREIDTQIPD